jgi:hypothetical protein
MRIREKYKTRPGQQLDLNLMPLVRAPYSIAAPDPPPSPE